MHNRIRGGFTLIEILIALTVLVVGLVGLLALFPVAIRSSNQGAEDSHASIIAKSVKNAIVVGVHNARIVTGDRSYFEIPFSHSGVPYEGDSGDGVSDWDPTNTDDQYLCTNEAGAYFMALPVDPVAAAGLGVPGQVGMDGSMIESTRDSLLTYKYFFPPRGLTGGGFVPAPVGSNTGTPIPSTRMIDEKFNHAKYANQRVFYMGRWTEVNGARIQNYNLPDRIMDLERSGTTPEDKDPYAQYCYRLSAEPVVEQRTSGGDLGNFFLVDGLWSFTIYVYRRYDEGLCKPNTVGWNDPASGVDTNKLIHKFTFHVVIR